MHTRLANGQIHLFKNILIQLALICSLFGIVSANALAYSVLTTKLHWKNDLYHEWHRHESFHGSHDQAFEACQQFLQTYIDIRDNIHPKCMHPDPGNGYHYWAGHIRIQKDPDIYHFGYFHYNQTCPDGSAPSQEFGCQKPEDSGNQCGDGAPPSKGNPISTAYGNKFQTETDYAASGSFPLSFSRFYNSRSQSEDLSIGQNWTHSHQKTIEPMSVTAADVTHLIGYNLARQDGRNIKFSPEAGQSTDYPVVLSDEIIDGDKTLRTATYKNGTVETYEMSLDAATNTMSVGRLVSIRNIQGFTQTLAYNAQDQLEQVSDDNGNTLTFTYNAEGKMETMTDPDQNVYTYVYEGDLLVSVIYPDSTPGDDSDNPSKTYHYEDSRFPTALTGITNENNVRYATWEYDDNGRAYVSKHAGDSGIDETSIIFNEDGSRTVTNPLGKQTTYHFITVNDNLRVDRVEGHPSPSCGGTNRGYTYDANGFIKTKTDWNGNITSYVRDEMGRIEQKTVALGTTEAMTTGYQYHPTLKLKTQIDLHKGEGIESTPIKLTSIVYYGDEAGEEYWKGLVKSRTVTDPATGESRTISYTYYAENGEGGSENNGGARQLKTVDGPRNDVQDITTYTYDAKGNLKTTTNALNHTSEITEYDGAGRPLTIVDQNLVETVLTYTPRGWLETSTKLSSQNQGALTQYIYDAVGNVTDIIAPDGSTITYKYDDANRLTDIFDKHGNNIHYDLNAMGGITGQQIKDPSGTLTMVRTTVRDELNRIKHSIGANVEEDIETNYDDNGNVDNTVDAYQRVTDNSFDALNRITQTQDTAGGITVTRYDDFGNIEEVEDPRGLITKYNYNALGDLKQLTSPDTGITTYTHDSAGNVKTQAGANNITVTYIYDALNRLTDVTYPDNSENIHYGYDATSFQGQANTNYGIGRLTSINDQSGTIEYKYNAKGLVSDEIRTIADTAYSLGYQYNAADKLTHITYPSGMIVEYIRDDAGKIVGVTATRDGQITTLADAIQYKPFGPQTNLQFGNGYIQTNNYNLNYQLDSIVTPGVLNLDYAYDYMGNITGMQDMLDSLFDQSYALDNLYRLDTAAGEYGVIDYDLDATGNRIAITEDGFQTNYSVDPASNRIDNIGDISFGYDAEGNTKTKNTPSADWAYGYNQNGRLQTVTKDGNQVAQYIYNALGQRTQKITEAGTTTQLFNTAAQLLFEETQTTTKEYIYLGGQVLASYTTAEDVQPEPQPGPCPGTTATNSQHESAGRAYSESETTGQTCFGTFCWGGTTTTTWYATGSNENLGTSGSSSTTLYENGTNHWQTANPNNCVQLPTGPCEAITSTNQQHVDNTRAYTTTEMVGQTCWGTFCYGGTEQTVYKAQGSDDELGTEATAQTTLYQDPNGNYYLEDPETCPVELENPNYNGFAYYHNDHLGTPRVVTAEDGTQLWKGDYNPFGKVKETQNQDAYYEQNIRFPGQVLDSETGLYYNYFRFYDPSLGRYTTSDPIGLAGGLNTYAYVGGNPVRFTDPLGLIPPYWTQKQKYGPNWQPTDASRRNAQQEATGGFSDMGTYTAWGAAAAGSRGFAPAAAVLGTASLGFGSLQWLLDKTTPEPNNDNDYDGIPNTEDNDDDNDGIPDAQDPDPYIWTPTEENGGIKCKKPKQNSHSNPTPHPRFRYWPRWDR